MKILTVNFLHSGMLVALLNIFLSALFSYIENVIFYSVACSPQANYTDRAAAAY
jgi:hypothetical protein